jgi:hypothetical protein
MLEDFYSRLQKSLKQKNVCHRLSFSYHFKDWNIRINPMESLLCKQITPLSLMMRQGSARNTLDLVHNLDYGGTSQRLSN